MMRAAGCLTFGAVAGISLAAVTYCALSLLRDTTPD